MWTASFFTARLELSDRRCVAISRTVPKRYSTAWRRYEPLMPWWELVNGYNRGLSQAFYTELFNRSLARLKARRVIADLGDDAILLCWEPAREFCHRRLVAEWLRRETGLVVPEWPEGWTETLPAPAPATRTQR